MKFTILTENTANKRGILAEHGLSVWIEAKGKKLLFDTGQTDVYLKNAQKLGICVEDADAVIFSHGHYDHCGGFAWFPQKGKKVYLGKGAFEEKGRMAEKSGNPKEHFFYPIGIGYDKEETGADYEEGQGRREIFPDIFLISPIPAVFDWEQVDSSFCIRTPLGIKRDFMEDEQLLVIREPEGLYVFTGCAHVGIANCLEFVKSSFPGEKIHTLLAGMHLRGCGKERLERTISKLKEEAIERVIPLHCTGIMAACQIKLALGERCQLGEAGKSF